MERIRKGTEGETDYVHLSHACKHIFFAFVPSASFFPHRFFWVFSNPVAIFVMFVGLPVPVPVLANTRASPVYGSAEAANTLRLGLRALEGKGHDFRPVVPGAFLAGSTVLWWGR